MSIRLSPKHGLNPAIPVCFFCGGDKNEIVIPGLMKGDREAPRKAVWNMEPCDQCAHFMTQGVILIEVDEAKTTDRANPYRAGGWLVVKDHVITGTVNSPELAASILEKRVAFIPTDAWDKLGLPRGEGTHPESTNG